MNSSEDVSVPRNGCRCPFENESISRRPTCDRNAEEGGEGAGGQDESPAASELTSPDPIQSVLVQCVMVAAQTESVNPGEERVAVVPVDGGQRQQRGGCPWRHGGHKIFVFIKSYA